MQRSVIILDDVLENAEEIRETGLRMTWAQKADNDYFPGRNSARAARIPALEEAAMRATGERLLPATSGYGRFRLALEGEEGRGGVHVDECHWSGIYYLSRDADCTGGTNFYRHRATGSEHAPYLDRHLRDWGYDSYADFVNRVSKPHAKDPSQWEHIMQVPMRFNRLVLFRPWLWHNAGPSFGASPETGRLVYLLFFNNADAMRQAG